MIKGDGLGTGLVGIMEKESTLVLLGGLGEALPETGCLSFFLRLLIGNV